MRLKKLRITLVLLLIITFTGTMPPTLAVVWSSDTPLNTYPESWERYPSVMQAADGRIWVVWASDKNAVHLDLFYNTTDDGGLSWSSPPTPLTTHPDSDVMPSVMQAADGRIWLVWASDRTDDYEIYYKTSVDGGLSWSSPPTQLTDYPSGRDSDPSIMQDADGRIWVVWVRDVEGNYDLYYKTSVDGGLSWSSPATQLTTHPSWDLSPSIMQDVEGRIWVAWASYRTGNYDVYYKTSVDGGLSWSSPPTPLTTHPDFDETPSITQAADGRIWVVWVSDRTAKDSVYSTTSENYGSTWSPGEELAVSAKDELNPSIASTNERRIWLVWVSTRTGDYEIFYKFSDVIPVHDVAITDVTPSLDVVEKGETLSVSVVAENQGTEDETFEVSCYANSTLIGSQMITLTSGTSQMLSFPYDTSDLAAGTYTVSANANAVPGETIANAADNSYIDGTVVVIILGDITGDGLVDILDKWILDANWGPRFTPENPDYDPDADINGDGVVNILDKSIMYAHWGW